MDGSKFRELKEGVLRYVREHPGVLTSEVIEAFSEYEPLVVLGALYELEDEGRVRGEDVGESDQI